MDFGKEFEKYAVKHRGISSNTLDGYIKHSAPMATASIPGFGQVGDVTALTPNIIEERPMNVAVMDVYSRLMMDRIIFLGYPIMDEVANIVTAQLLFLESTAAVTYRCTSTAPAAAYMPAWACTTPCSL